MKRENSYQIQTHVNTSQNSLRRTMMSAGHVECADCPDGKIPKPILRHFIEYRERTDLLPLLDE